MGRATKWLKSLWRGKKQKQTRTVVAEERQNQIFRGNSSSKLSATTLLSASESWAEFVSETEKEKKMDAIAAAAAAATAAAADAAVAAAQAAAAIVRLTSQGRITSVSSITRSRRQAAVKIQTAFRGYLARKALKALKGLVKLQAYVRGYLVRREAVKALYSMQALLQAQAATRTRHGHGLGTMNQRSSFQPCWHRTLQERFDETRSENVHMKNDPFSVMENHGCLGAGEIPKDVEVDSFRQKSWPHRVDAILSESLSSSLSSKSFSSHTPVMSPRSVAYGWSDCWSASAQSTPRATKINTRNSNSTGYYMSRTEPFAAKPNPQSIAKLRADALVKKMLSLEGAGEVQASLSGLRVNRPCSSDHEAFSFKNVVANRLSRSPEPSPRASLAQNDSFSFMPQARGCPG